MSYKSSKKTTVNITQIVNTLNLNIFISMYPKRNSILIAAINLFKSILLTPDFYQMLFFFIPMLFSPQPIYTPTKAEVPSILVEELAPPPYTSEIETLSNLKAVEAEYNNGEEFTPNSQTCNSKVYNELQLIDITSCESIGEYVFKTQAVVEEILYDNLHKEIAISDKELIANDNYVKKAAQAKSLEEELYNTPNKSHDSQFYEEVISLREEALSEVTNCPQIALQLGRNYYEYASYIKFNLQDNEYNNQKVAEYSFKAIEMFEYVLRYDYRTNESADTIYRIGQAYHLMSTITELDDELRNKYLLTAYSHYELSIKEDSISYDYYNIYYSAMTFHKLGIINEENNAYFLHHAYISYEKLTNDPNTKDTLLINSTKYIVDSTDRLIIHINQYGVQENLLSTEEYHTINKEYQEKIYR